MPFRAAGTCPSASRGVNLSPDYTTGIPVGNIAREGEAVGPGNVKVPTLSSWGARCAAAHSMPSGCPLAFSPRPALAGTALANGTSMWVPAPTPAQCCAACSAYPTCHAWTWKDAGYCTIGRVPQPTPCCFFKAGWGRVGCRSSQLDCNRLCDALSDVQMPSL